MNRFALRALPVFAALAALLAWPSIAGAATYQVCQAGPPACDFGSLSDAVDDPGTVDGDVIQVAAGTYVEPEGVDVTKGLDIVGAGSGSTIIDGGAGNEPGQAAQLNVQTGSGQDVSITGLTVRDPVADNGLRIAIFSKSTDVPGPSHTFTDVAIRGVGGAPAGTEHGLWTFNSTADLVYQGGSVSNVRYNPILIEQPRGATTVAGNEIARGTECCGVFYMTSIEGESSSQPQRFLDNELTGGAGVTFSSAFVPTAGGFSSIEVSDNSLQGVTGGGITLLNGGSGSGAAAAITNPVVHDNVVEGAGGASRGISIRGRVLDASVRGNSLTGLGVGVHAADGTGGPLSRPLGTSVQANRIVDNALGLENQASATGVDAEQNWWGCNEGPAGDDCNDVTGLVDFDPWLVLSLDGPTAIGAGDTAGYQASVATTSDGGAADAPSDFPAAVVDFGASAGTIDSPEDLAASVASTSYTAPNLNGPVELTATLDAETVDLGVDVSGAPLQETSLDARPMVLDNQPSPIRLVTPIGRFTANLTDPATGAPIEGKEIVFSTQGEEICRNTTSANGEATCAVNLGEALIPLLRLGYEASFAGDANTEAVSDDGGLIRLLDLLEL